MSKWCWCVLLIIFSCCILTCHTSKIRCTSSVKSINSSVFTIRHGTLTSSHSCSNVHLLLLSVEIGNLVLVDLDDICISNTNRQLHTLRSSIGKMKIDEMKGTSNGTS